MPSSSDFFGQRNAQAVLKHGILTRYAYYFAGRAGSATQGRVAFIDGYAGEGRYEDGNPGSPLLLASQANRALLFGRDVKLLSRTTIVAFNCNGHSVTTELFLTSYWGEILRRLSMGS